MVTAISAIGALDGSSPTWLLSGLLFPSSVLSRRLKVKDLHPPGVALALSPGSGLLVVD